MKPFAAFLGASAIALAVAVAPFTAYADDAAKPTPVDGLFARQAATMNYTEIELSKHAADNASTPSVKAFAQKMVDDHTKAGDELKKIADGMDISLPSSLGDAHSKFQSDLKGLEGVNYERAYVQAMVTDHAMAVALFEDEAKNGNNLKLKQFATDTLPTLKAHQSEAQALEGTITHSEAAPANQ